MNFADLYVYCAVKVVSYGHVSSSISVRIVNFLINNFSQFVPRLSDLSGL